MVYEGAVAAGAFPGSEVVLFGSEIESTGWAYVAMAMAGTIGYTLGSILGWAIGRYGGRPYLERHGRWLHITPAKLDKADAWFERYGDATVFVSRMLPVVRSFVSIPAGIGEMPFVRFTVSRSPARYRGASGSPASASRSAVAGRSSTRASATRTTRSSRSWSPGQRLAYRWHRRRARSSRWKRSAEGPAARLRRFPARVHSPHDHSARRRQGPVRAPARGVEDAPRRRPRLGPVHPRAGGARLRARGRAYLGAPKPSGSPTAPTRSFSSWRRWGRPRRRGHLPAFTFYATAEAVSRVGGTPVFCDIEPASLNLDPADVAARVSPSTRAILAVHLFGRPHRSATYPRASRSSRTHAQAFGAEHRQPACRGGRRRRHVQLLPDEEPLRPGRRRARLHERPGAGRTRPAAPLPRLARQGDASR